MQQNEFNQGLLDFIQASPTPFHAVENIARRLQDQGFARLEEAQSWDLDRGRRYFVVRNASSIIAFILGQGELTHTGIRMMGAHTDSPCLKIKPHPEMVKTSYYQLGVEVYGGALLNPWFDRDLSVAGRVSYVTSAKELAHDLIDFRKPMAVIPSLAIHLDREANQSRSINAQLQLPPIVRLSNDSEKPDFRKLLLQQLRSQHQDCDASEVLDYELSLYDTQPPAIVGLDDDFIASARLDNLLSCYVGMQALLQAGDTASSLLVCNDHEEVGSVSSAGAQGPFLESVLARLSNGAEDMGRTIDRSYMISTDNAHGIHPNFSDKHDDNHGPLLNSGPVIKINANQRYATTSETSALFRHLCDTHKLPVQSFVVRSDMVCGSTIGPITAARIGVKTLDVGVPTFAMHSIRELAGIKDAYYLFQALAGFCQHKS